MKEIIGIVTKISTTADMCVRIQIDIDKDKCPSDIITALNDEVFIGIKGEEKEHD